MHRLEISLSLMEGSDEVQGQGGDGVPREGRVTVMVRVSAGWGAEG